MTVEGESMGPVFMLWPGDHHPYDPTLGNPANFGIALHSSGAPAHKRFAWLVFSPAWSSFSVTTMEA